MKDYIEWVKDNWQKSAILVLIYVLASLVPLFSKLDLIELMLLLAFPLYLVHEIEEYILPGGFPEFFNENLLKVNANDKIVPVDREVSLWINLIYIWVALPLFTGLGFFNIKFAVWIPYFFFFQAIGHLGMGIKGKMILNPGIRSSFILHVPYAIIMINLFVDKGILTNPYMNIYMVIGFGFNLLLPILAKTVILPRYHKRVKEQ